ncbi:MAG: hypothetical protein NTW56_19090 [Alphaproteobacteria bacterium]|nr:hypothetical protein [Alphaproteobacteria bacterium]
MKFRVQTGHLNGSAWVQGEHDLSIEADSFELAKTEAIKIALEKFWVEEGEWLRVIGNNQEYRWPAKPQLSSRQ